MKKLPIALIYLRLAIGIALPLIAYAQPKGVTAILITLVSAGLLSDIFDGIIARRLNVSGEKMRKLDSTIDQLFWAGVIIASYIVAPGFYTARIIPISIIIALEIICYLISYLKFKQVVATHAIASKIFTLFLFATLVEVVIRGDSGILFHICFVAGIITRLEIIAILLLLKNYVTDVPTLWHAIRLRENKPIKRNKLFNG